MATLDGAEGSVEGGVPVWVFERVEVAPWEVWGFVGAPDGACEGGGGGGPEGRLDVKLCEWVEGVGGEDDGSAGGGGGGGEAVEEEGTVVGEEGVGEDCECEGGAGDAGADDDDCVLGGHVGGVLGD